MQVDGKLCDEINPSASVAMKELQKKVTQAEAGKRENFPLIIFSLHLFLFFFSLLANLIRSHTGHSDFIVDVAKD